MVEYTPELAARLTAEALLTYPEVESYEAVRAAPATRAIHRGVAAYAVRFKDGERYRVEVTLLEHEH